METGNWQSMKEAVTYDIGTTRSFVGDIATGMDEAEKWARELNGMDIKSDNDNKSGEVFFRCADTDENLFIRVKEHTLGCELVLLADEGRVPQRVSNHNLRRVGHVVTKEFRLTISLDNDQMKTSNDVCEALIEVRTKLSGYPCCFEGGYTEDEIRDENGNEVGRWEVVDK